MKLFIFGSTGDLVKSKVLPALHNLDNKNLEIWAIGRRDFEREVYHSFACSDRCHDSFKKRLHYMQVDFESEELCAKCLVALDKNAINYFYLATPPSLYRQILLSLAGIKKEGYKLRILIEKPFGESLKDAKALEKLITKENLADEIYLSDHYLFKKGIMNLKRAPFKRLEIIASEQSGLEGRTSFYEGIGALKDMVQSHLLNILFKLLPRVEDAKSLRIEGYSRGQCGDGVSTGYAATLGKPSGTETFAHMRLRLGSRKITLVTGKGLSQKETMLIIDGKKKEIMAGEAYERLFGAFFAGKKENFPSIDNAILAWGIVEKATAKKPPLFYYPRGSNIASLEKNIEKQTPDS